MLLYDIVKTHQLEISKNIPVNNFNKLFDLGYEYFDKIPDVFLELCIENNNSYLDILSHMLRYKFDMNSVLVTINYMNGYTPLMAIIERYNNRDNDKYIHIITKMIENGANLNYTIKPVNSPLI